MTSRRRFPRLLASLVALAAAFAPAWAMAATAIVFGGAGQLGSEVVRALAAAGHEVTVFHREGSDLSRLQGLKYTEAIGDATREEVAETMAMAVYMGGGPSLMYAADALRAYDQYKG